MASILEAPSASVRTDVRIDWVRADLLASIEKVALPEPTGFDPPDKLDAFLDAVRSPSPSRPAEWPAE